MLRTSDGLGENVTLESDFFVEDIGKPLAPGDGGLLLFGVVACCLSAVTAFETVSAGDLSGSMVKPLFSCTRTFR